MSTSSYNIKRLISKWFTQRSRPRAARSSLIVGLVRLEDRDTPASVALLANILMLNYAAPAENVTINNDGTNVSVSGAASGAFPTTNIKGIEVLDPSMSGGQSVTIMGLPFSLSSGLTTSNVESVTIGAPLAATGTAAISIVAPQSIEISTSLSTDSGDLTLKANTQAIPTNGSFVGVTIGSTTVSSAHGRIDIEGHGGDGSVGAQYGVLVQGSIGATTNSVNLIGAGGASSGNNDCGVRVNGIVTSGGGDVSIQGFGGGIGNARSNHGVLVDSGGKISSGLNGKVTIAGTGGFSAGDGNYGVFVSGAGSQVTSSANSIQISGVGGGTGASQDNLGVAIADPGAQVMAGGVGTVTVEGTGGNTTGNSNAGVSVSGTITSAGGNVVVKGFGGGNSSSANNHGIRVHNLITAGGNGTVILQGKGGAAGGPTYGIYVPGGIIASGAGAVTITAESANENGEALFLAIGGKVTSGGNGSVTIVADSVNMSDNLSGIQAGSAGNSAVLFHPKTVGAKIDIGGKDVLDNSALTLGLNDVELSQVVAGSIQIGDADSGAISVSDNIIRSSKTSLTIQTGSAIDLGADINSDDGNITFISTGAVTQSAGKVLAGGGTLTLSLANDQTATFNSVGNSAGQVIVSNKVTVAVNGSFNDPSITKVTGTLTGTGIVGNVIVLNGGTIAPGASKLVTGNVDFKAGSTYSVTLGGLLNVTGTINLESANLNTTAGAKTSLIKLIDNDGSDAVTGTFTGLAENAKVTVGGREYRISYEGGSGNDIVLSSRTPLQVTGADAGGGPHVIVRNADQSVRFSFFAFGANFMGGVRVAAGDVNGDGRDDIITAAGPGGGPHVRIFDGIDGNLITEFYAYSPTFSNGIYVATGDIDGDGRFEVITGAGPGGGPHVRVFSVADDGTLSVRREFYAYNLDFAGGVNVADGDVDADGMGDIITGAGPGGGPHVRVFSGADNKVMTEFYAYAANFTGGVSVAAGDLDHDGKADIITGAGVGGTPHVRVLKAIDLSVLREFFAYDVSFAGGVRVGASDINGDGFTEIYTGTGASSTIAARLRWFDGSTNAMLLDVSALGGFMGGIFVG